MLYNCTDLSDLVLESAALMVMDAKDLSAREALDIDAMLQDEFASLDLAAGKYIAAQSLIGTNVGGAAPACDGSASSAGAPNAPQTEPMALDMDPD